VVHRQRGEADIHPVEIGNEVAQDQQRQQAARDAVHRCTFKFGHAAEGGG
jgi:hypothetical protein